jgi:hypothetical protein
MAEAVKRAPTRDAGMILERLQRSVPKPDRHPAFGALVASTTGDLWVKLYPGGEWGTQGTRRRTKAVLKDTSSGPGQGHPPATAPCQ